MTNPLPPFLHMENQNEKRSSVSRRVKQQILESFPQEQVKNPLWVGFGKKTCYIQPHNYRRYFDFEMPQKPTWVRLVGKIINSKELFFKDFQGCNIKIKKNQIEILNLIEHKKWYAIDITNFEFIECQVAEVIAKKEKECIDVLKNFIAESGGKSNFKVLNWHEEIKVMNEDFIDKIPLKMKFRNEVVKKLYNEKNIEHSDAAFTSTFLKARSLEDVTPPILSELQKINQNIKLMAAGISKKSSKDTPTIKPASQLNVKNLGFPQEDFNFMLNKMRNVWHV